MLNFSVHCTNYKIIYHNYTNLKKNVILFIVWGSWNRDFFFQNNTESQTILLVSTFSKQFSKLTSRVKETRFCCAKSSVMNSSSMKLESLRLNFPESNEHQTSSNQMLKQEKQRTQKTQTRKQWLEENLRLELRRRHCHLLEPLPSLPRFSSSRTV